MVARANGIVDEGFARALHTIDAFYELPYLAHAPMEPNNAVCRMSEDGVLEVWAGTESPVYAQMVGSRVGGVDQQRVRVHAPDAGGSFGLHSSSGKNDPAAEGVQIAKALDWRYLIKVLSSRVDRSASACALRATAPVVTTQSRRVSTGDIYTRSAAWLSGASPTP